MILITGGAGAGKRDFAKRQFPGVKTGERQPSDEPRGDSCGSMQLIDAFQEEVRACLKDGRDPYAEAERLLAREDVVVLLDEVGCGVVPMDAFERQYRETVGRVGCCLAESASEVWRVVLGIGTRIK